METDRQPHTYSVTLPHNERQKGTRGSRGGGGGGGGGGLYLTTAHWSVPVRFILWYACIAIGDPSRVGVGKTG